MNLVLHHIGKITLILIGLSLLVLLNLNSIIQNKSTENTINAALENSRGVVNQYKALRSYYTKNIISVVKKSNGAVKPHYEHQGSRRHRSIASHHDSRLIQSVDEK